MKDDTQIDGQLSLFDMMPAEDGDTLERETGLQDLFIPLWYEQESRRLYNYPGEDFEWEWNQAHRKNELASWEQEETKGEES